MCHQINQLPASFSWSHRNKFVQNSFCGLSKALRTFAPHWTTPWEKTFEKTLIEGQGRSRWAFCEFAACVLRQGFPAVSFGTCCSTQKACTPHQAMAQERHRVPGRFTSSIAEETIYLFTYFQIPKPLTLLFFFLSSTDPHSQHPFKAKWLGQKLYSLTVVNGYSDGKK